MPTATKKRGTGARKSPAKKTAARRANQRTLSPTHKKALAKGRTLSSTVERYITAINTPKRRGRKVSQATLVTRLVQEQDRLKHAVGVERVLAAQSIRDVKARMAEQAPAAVDIKALERDFVKIAKEFGENRHISYGAWREAGVSAPVLAKCGIRRTRDVTA